MKTILASLLATALLTIIAHGDVLIYTGINRFTADATTSAPFKNKNLSAYYVVDYDGKQVGSVLYGQILGGKRFQRSNAATQNFTNVILSNGKAASIFVKSASTNTSPTQFNNEITYFRGTNTSLLIRRTPSPTLTLRPKLLGGTSLTATGDALFTEQHIGLTFQSGPTIKANNDSLTIDDALDAFIATLMAKGFTSI